MESIEIGENIFDREEMFASLVEFGRLYDRRPIRDNRGGMTSCHLFGTWYVAKKLNPAFIIESGVFKGQGTWILREACPKAKIICIDPRLDKVEYTPLPPDCVSYWDEDFSTHDWQTLGVDTEETLCFFDDHQDANTRLVTALIWGFRHLMFEDNYPRSQGDCISLKAMLEDTELKGNMATNLLEIYCEMPPVHKVSKTRWGDPWTSDEYPTPEPLLRSIVECPPRALDCFIAEAQDYTWLCYAKIIKA